MPDVFARDHHHVPYLSCLVRSPDVSMTKSARLFFSSSGWTTGQLMIQYINHIIVPYTRDEPTLLIIDCYESHLTSTFLQHAHAHNIRVATVPSSTTFLRQPLDVGVFNTIKSKWRHDWDQALNDWFEERPHTQPPSSSLNPVKLFVHLNMHGPKCSKTFNHCQLQHSPIQQHQHPVPATVCPETTLYRLFSDLSRIIGLTHIINPRFHVCWYLLCPGPTTAIPYTIHPSHSRLQRHQTFPQWSLPHLLPRSLFVINVITTSHIIGIVVVPP